jgi:hypothetical protein
MKHKLHYPLWVHLPAIGLAVFVCFRIAQAWPIPDYVALHFGLSEPPNRWGHPWEVLAFNLGIMVGFIALTMFVSEIWARLETGKNFNWVALFDEAIVGALAVITVHWLDMVRQQQPTWNTPWTTMAVVTTGAVLAAACLERMRPFRAFPHKVHAEDTGTLEALVASRMHDGRPWAYWESQNSVIISVLSLTLLLGMTTAALLTVWNTSSWFPGVLILVPAIAGLLAYGGLRVQVAHGHLVVRVGVLGFRLLRIPLNGIASVQVQTFNPLREFRGWGPARFGYPGWSVSSGERRGVWAFYFRGTEGVKLVRKNGRIFLIGSDHPERLCAVLRTAANLPSES